MYKKYNIPTKRTSPSREIKQVSLKINVEDSLIREQLEMIKNYAESRNVMLLLTTHRLDLAADLATKRYNINSAGVLEQMPVKQEEEKNRESHDER